MNLFSLFGTPVTLRVFGSFWSFSSFLRNFPLALRGQNVWGRKGVFQFLGKNFKFFRIFRKFLKFFRF